MEQRMNESSRERGVEESRGTDRRPDEVKLSWAQPGGERESPTQVTWLAGRKTSHLPGWLASLG